jgi:predicted DNA-binding antitoxin AbrB/MazE fold protein
MGEVIEAIYEDGVFKPLSRIKPPKSKKVEILIMENLVRDIDNVFGILKEDIDIKKIRKEMDRYVLG